MRYLDATALVRLVVDAPASGPLRAFLAATPDVPAFASALVHVELLRAAEADGPTAVAAAREVLARVALVDVTRDVLERAATLAPDAAVDAADAVHLATAALVGARLHAFVSYDARRRAAAEALGMRTTAP